MREVLRHLANARVDLVLLIRATTDPATLAELEEAQTDLDRSQRRLIALRRTNA